MQKRIGINVSKDAAFKMIMEYSHWKANGALAKAFVDRSAETIEWMDKLGIKVEYVGVGGFGGPLTWHVIAPGPDYPDKNPHDFHCAPRHQRVQQIHSRQWRDNPDQDTRPD